MDPINLYKLNRDELYKIACIRNIRGRSNMNKNELIESLYAKENKAKLVLNCSYDYSSESSDDSSVNDYEDNDEKVYESFRDFSKNNSNITEKVKYVYVCSGYSHRVFEIDEVLMEFNNQTEAVSILPDLYWRENYKPYTADYNALELCLYLPINYIKRGGIVYKLKDKPDGTELLYVDMVGDLDFFAFCQGSEASAKWYEIENEILLVFDVNTESG